MTHDVLKNQYTKDSAIEMNRFLISEEHLASERLTPEFLKRLLRTVAVGVLLPCSVLANESDEDSASGEESDDVFNLTIEDLIDVPVKSIDFFETSLTYLPNHVSVITDKDLSLRPVHTIEESIQHYVPGVRVGRQGVSGPVVSVRGMGTADRGNEHMLVMWDGKDITPRIAGGYSTGHTSYLLGDVKQVEVVLGPGSLYHGTGALNGYINLVPKNGLSNSGWASRTDLGLIDDLFRMDAEYGLVYGEDKHYYVYGGYLQAGGHNFRNDFGLGLPEDQRDSVNDYAPSYKLSGNWTHNRFNMTALFEHIEADPNTLFFGGTRRLLRSGTVLSLQPRYTFNLSEQDTLEVAGGFTLIDTNNVREHIANPEENPTRTDGASEGNALLRTTYQTTRFDNHKISVGALLQWRKLRSQQLFFSQTATTDPQNATGDWLEYAIFAEDKLKLSEKLSFTGGLRLDRTRFDEFESDILSETDIRFQPDDVDHLSSNFSLDYQHSESQGFRLSYREGFGFPALQEYPQLFAVNRYLESIGAQTLAEPEPDTNELWELAWASHMKDRGLALRMSLFHNRFDDPLTFRFLDREPFVLPPEVAATLPPDLNFAFFNSGTDFASVGTEIAVDWSPTDQWQLGASYSYARPYNLSAEENTILDLANEDLDEWTRNATHMVKTDLAYRNMRWGVELAALYQSGSENPFAEILPDQLKDSHFRVNAAFNYNVSKSWQTSFVVKNLFGNVTPPINHNTQNFFGTLGVEERRYYLTFKWQQ